VLLDRQGVYLRSQVRGQRRNTFCLKIKGKGEEMKILLMSKEKKKLTWPPTCPRKSETLGLLFGSHGRQLFSLFP
jgi:hypothetical protein